MSTTQNDITQALRRIDKLEAVRRRVARSLARCAPGSPVAEGLAEHRNELSEQIAHLREAVEAARERGLKIWSREDFRPGDFVRIRGIWYEVLRVNARSVTVPHVPPGTTGDIVRQPDTGPGWAWTARYHDGITGRMSAGEMASRGMQRGPENHDT